MLLSNTAILRHLKKWNIVISPFKKENLGNVSYDVSLGKYYYRENEPREGYTVYNPYQKEEVERVWGKKCHEARPFKDWLKQHGNNWLPFLKNIKPNDLVIWIAPGETILAHTEEFIGGKNIVTTMMKARSSLGRNFIEIAKCAGWGDVGYINRWTLEITNNSRYYHIPLVVGRRVGQLAFFEVEPIIEKSDYHKAGKYQNSFDLKKLKKDWRPEMMLPKLWKDREIYKK